VAGAQGLQVPLGGAVLCGAGYGRGLCRLFDFVSFLFFFLSLLSFLGGFVVVVVLLLLLGVSKTS
jgi:hypothetical protein